MKFMKKGVRVWFTVASVFSFLTGWAFLAHAQKPAPLPINSKPSIAAPVNNPVALPSTNNNTNSFSSGNSFFFNQSQPVFRPMLRTGGS